jgi:hypothetical protein
MKFRCPNCRETLALNPSAYRIVLNDAEVGLYHPVCPACGHTWSPAQEEQIIIAADVRRLLAITF